MKRHFFGFLLILSFVVGVAAQKPQIARSGSVDANLRKTIEYLASDRLEGRRTGEPGATLAADYIAKTFAELGLKPGFTPTKGRPNYRQPFPYVTGVELEKTGNEVTFDVVQDAAGNRIKITNGLPAKPVGFSPNGSVENAPVIYAGFGIVSTDPQFDDYKYGGKEIDVRGKVVIVFDGTPDNDNPHSPYGRFDLRTKALIAKDKGAVGMLVISRETKFEEDRLTRLGYDQSLGEAAIPMIVVARRTAGNILGVAESELAGIEFFSSAKTTPGLEGRAKLPDTQPAVTFKVSLVKKQVDAYNVIGILPGTDPKLKSEAIVIGAHYDHLGHGGQGSLAANSTEIHHGADDNASGVAAIIELARQFAKERKNKRTIIFIAFSGEEEGLFGSSFYVQNPVFPLEQTVAMINLDMVGRLKDEKLTVGGMGTASEWKNLVSSNNHHESVSGFESSPPSTMGVSKETGKVQRFPNFTLQLNEDGYGPSDHSSFYSKKVPVLFFFTGTHNEYHKPTDTADRINYDGEAKVVAYVTSIANAVDQNPQRPTYTVAKSTGMSGARSGFNISLGTIPNYADSTDGLLLDGVRDNSPAAKAGVKAGDKVVKLAGHDIRNVMDYTYILGEMKADVEYEIVVLRGTERLTLKIVPVKR